MWIICGCCTICLCRVWEVVLPYWPITFPWVGSPQVGFSARCPVTAGCISHQFTVYYKTCYRMIWIYCIGNFFDKCPSSFLVLKFNNVLIQEHFFKSVQAHLSQQQLWVILYLFYSVIVWYLSLCVNKCLMYANISRMWTFTEHCRHKHKVLICIR